jgi:hypothetical protein
MTVIPLGHDGGMSEAKTSAQVTQGADRPEQLTLLGSSSVSARFKLSRDTRERGLRHIAEIRQLLAAGHADQRAA